MMKSILFLVAFLPGMLVWGSEVVGKTAADPEAEALVREVVSQRPEKETVFYGVFKLRDGSGRRSEVPVKYTVDIGDDHWKGIYEAKATLRNPAERLEIIYQADGSKEYRLTRLASAGGTDQTWTLQGDQAFFPFAGSNYWLADLGLEFLSWPQQRLLRDLKVTMKNGRPCKILESVNPTPSGNAYSRVVSWIDNEFLVPIYATAYGQDGKELKTFALKGFKKVNGRWEPKDLEILNEQTDSRTRLEFLFETE